MPLQEETLKGRDRSHRKDIEKYDGNRIKTAQELGIDQPPFGEK
jgi:hypothetical protein